MKLDSLPSVELVPSLHPANALVCPGFTTAGSCQFRIYGMIEHACTSEFANAKTFIMLADSFTLHVVIENGDNKSCVIMIKIYEILNLYTCRKHWLQEVVWGVLGSQ